MEEIQKLLPLWGFLGTICTALTAAILLKASNDRLSKSVSDIANVVAEIDKDLAVEKAKFYLKFEAFEKAIEEIKNNHGTH